MTRSRHRLILSIVLAVLFAPALNVRASAGQKPEKVSLLVGRLATVEPARRRLTIVPEGEAEMVALLWLRGASAFADASAFAEASTHQP